MNDLSSFYDEPPDGWRSLVAEPEPRFKIYLEWRDIWIGAYIASDAVYVCPLPCVVLRFRRKPKPCRPIPCPPYEEAFLTEE